MKTDVYTKIILTVIAIGLFANFFKGADIVTTAQAQNTLPPPTVAEQPKTIDVNIVSLNGMPLLLRTIDTKEGKSALLPLSIENISKPLDVNLSQYGGSRISRPSDGSRYLRRYYDSIYYIPISIKDYESEINVWVKNWP